MSNKLLLEQKKIFVSEGLKYHIEEDLGLEYNIYRPDSEKFFSLFEEARILRDMGLYEANENEDYYLGTDIGKYGNYEGEMVPLDWPLPLIAHYPEGDMDEAEYKGRKVDLNKPKRGGSKKFYVYVKDPKTKNVKKVEFGAKGMSVGLKDPKRRKSFAARHNCDDKKDKTAPGYWACRLGRYPHLTGSKKKYQWW